MTGDKRTFLYWRDPLCLVSVAAYSVNRWIVPIAWQAPWWRGHFADLLLVPAMLPIWLWFERRIGWRGDDRAPRAGEILFALCIWSVAAELVAPHLFSDATRDIWDVAAYALGALLTGLWWQRTA